MPQGKGLPGLSDIRQTSGSSTVLDLLLGNYCLQVLTSHSSRCKFPFWCDLCKWLGAVCATTFVEVVHSDSWWLLVRSWGDTSESPASPRGIQWLIQNQAFNSTHFSQMHLLSEILLNQCLFLAFWVLELRWSAKREGEKVDFRVSTTIQTTKILIWSGLTSKISLGKIILHYVHWGSYR